MGYDDRMGWDFAGYQWIESVKDKCGGKPVLVGTRITVAQFLAELAEGRSVSRFAEAFDLHLDVCTGALEELAQYLDK